MGATKRYEPERARIKAKHAFMRNLTSPNFITAGASRASKLTKSTVSSLSYLPATFFERNYNNKSSIKYYNEIKPSVKEFSYFDWSKVKLLSSGLVGESLSSREMAAQNGQDNSEDTLNRLIQRATASNNNYKELPQVITIRFT